MQLTVRERVEADLSLRPLSRYQRDKLAYFLFWVVIVLVATLNDPQLIGALMLGFFFLGLPLINIVHGCSTHAAINATLHELQRRGVDLPD